MRPIVLNPVHSRLDHWWVLIARGLLAIGFGVLAIAWPQITMVVLIALFAAYALLDGVVSIVSALRNHDYGWQLVGGVLSLGMGVLVVLWPVSAGFALLLLIAAWAIARGIFDIAAAVTLRRELRTRYEWMLIISGVVSVLFGLFIAFRPHVGMFAVVGAVAGFSIFLGTTLIAAGLRQRSLKRNRFVTIGFLI
jgi:uncharacterized membrane protein HdeD (DUF308 family)